MSLVDIEDDFMASASFLSNLSRPIHLETIYIVAKVNVRNPMVRMILKQKDGSIIK